ncbi:MAG: hypothetical protein N2112_04960 [Gemmataceae bacterium]|nr:hypothetical protein [Gemmataceae bacterium]
MRLAVLSIVLTSFAVLAQTTPVETVTDAQIRKAIEDLGSSKFVVREKASVFLESLGRRAEPFLEEAAKSRDQEVSQRARDILAKYEWGLYPDTPKEMAKLITDFRSGNVDTQIQVIRKLAKMRPIPVSTIFKLVGKVTDEETKIIISAELANVVSKAVPELLIEADIQTAEKFLELTADLNAQTAHNYAIFQYQTGKLDRAIELWKKKPKPKDQAHNVDLVLLHLYRMKKDWAEAKKIADKIPQQEFQFKVRWEANDWKGLLELNKDLPSLELGEKATLYRLMGNVDKFRETLDELKKQLDGVEGDDLLAEHLGRVLLINGYGNEAIKLLTEKRSARPHFTFEILCAQGKYKEAFAFADQVKKEAKGENQSTLLLDLSRAKILAQLGDRDGAIQLYRKLAEGNPQEGIEVILSLILESADRAGLRRFAVEFLCEICEKEPHNQRLESLLLMGFNTLDRNRGEFLCLTYLSLRSQNKKETTAQTVARLFKLLEGTATKDDYEQAANAIERYRGTPMDQDPSPEWFHEHTRLRSAAQLLKLGQLHEKAKSLFEKAIDTKATATDLEILETRGVPAAQLPSGTRLLYAEYLLELKETKAALAQLSQLSRSLASDPLVAFLYGQTLLSEGREKEGKRLIEMAHLIPLADSDKRMKFSEDLAERGFHEEARKAINIIMETSWFNGVAEGNAHVRTARYLARKGDYQRAADLYEKDLAQMIFSTVSFVNAGSYLTIPQVIKTFRAQALLKEGKTDEAMKLIRDALDNHPRNVDLAIGLVPILDKQGNKKEANEIYNIVKKSYEDLIKDYPNNPELRNSLAWVMVNCIRDLDQARKHSEKAVELSPDSAGYWDTLAEIRFRQGDRKEALALMQKCARMEPKNPYFRKQLIRFEKAPFDSPVPDEETGED